MVDKASKKALAHPSGRRSGLSLQEPAGRLPRLRAWWQLGKLEPCMNAWRHIACACLLVACADETVHVDHADGSAKAVFEGCPETIPPFSVGMSTPSEDGQLKAVLVEASRVPPARFLNDWTVKLVDAADNEVSDTTLQRVRAFMPVHGHYGLPNPQLKRHENDPAVFDIDALNLFMRGPWQIKLDVSSTEGAEVELVFAVCVEE